MDGIINIYKEKGYTSHDVVAKMRGILRMKKIGHTGTLDPDAEGVLPVCVGKATKLVDLITDKDKTYLAVAKLGITTDTQDISGKVLTTSEVETDRDRLAKLIQSYIGEYLQLPPMYSAIKIDGRKLYEL
jgi:tRNA pseudouridine55 synthase